MLNSKIRSALWFAGKAAISIAFLLYVTRKIDLSSIRGDVRAMNLRWVAVYLIQLSFIPSLGGARWRLVLKSLGSTIGIWSSTRLFWIGMMFSQILPSSSGGDAIRIVIAWREGVPFARSAHSVILERLAMLYTLIILVAAMQLIVDSSLNLREFAWVGPVLLCVATLGMACVIFGDALIAYLPTWRTLLALSELSSDSRRLFLSRASIKLSGWSFLTHINIAVACLWLGNALGIQLNFVDYIFFISLVTLITSLPISIGGWGIREGAIVALFGKAGVSAHGALAFSVLFGLGVGAISIIGLPFVSLKKASRQASEGAELSCPTPAR